MSAFRLNPGGLLQLVKTNDGCLCRWRWTCRRRAAFPSKDREEACLWCITAPDCTRCLTATREEWKTVRSAQCLKKLKWNRSDENWIINPGYLNSVKIVYVFVGVYPEIPEGSQLDFSALKEEVPLGWLSFKCTFMQFGDKLFMYSCVLTDRASGFCCSTTWFLSPSCWTNQDRP